MCDKLQSPCHKQACWKCRLPCLVGGTGQPSTPDKGACAGGGNVAAAAWHPPGAFWPRRASPERQARKGPIWGRLQSRGPAAQVGPAAWHSAVWACVTVGAILVQHSRAGACLLREASSAEPELRKRDQGRMLQPDRCSSPEWARTGGASRRQCACKQSLMLGCAGTMAGAAGRRRRSVGAGGILLGTGHAPEAPGTSLQRIGGCPAAGAWWTATHPPAGLLQASGALLPAGWLA